MRHRVEIETDLGSGDLHWMSWDAAMRCAIIDKHFGHKPWADISNPGNARIGFHNAYKLYLICRPPSESWKPSVAEMATTWHEQMVAVHRANMELETIGVLADSPMPTLLVCTACLRLSMTDDPPLGGYMRGGEIRQYADTSCKCAEWRGPNKEVYDVTRAGKVMESIVRREFMEHQNQLERDGKSAERREQMDRLEKRFRDRYRLALQDADYDPVVKQAPEQLAGLGVRRLKRGAKWGVIYFLLRDGKVIRVGQSVNVEARIASHEKMIVFDDVMYLRCPIDALDQCESFWIYHLMPELNFTANGNRLAAPAKGVLKCPVTGQKRKSGKYDRSRGKVA